MTPIEDAYRTPIGHLSGQERVARTLSLLETTCSMLRRRVLAEDPGLSERAVRKRVAEALYRTDPAAQRLLSMIES